MSHCCDIGIRPCGGHMGSHKGCHYETIRNVCHSVFHLH